MEGNIFKPARRGLAAWCSIIFVAISINIYFLSKNNSFIIYFSLVLLTVLLLSLSMPLFRNQKFVIKGNNIRIFHFRKVNNLKFSRDLYEIVVKDSEIVSYRFSRKGKYYQISPYGYYKYEELKSIFTSLMKKTKNTISVVER
jgi:hypothetical protein